MKRIRIGKNAALKAQTKEAESKLDATSIMLAREQVLWVSLIPALFTPCQAKSLAKLAPRDLSPVSSPKSQNKLMRRMSGLIAEKKSAAQNPRIS